MNDTAFCDRLEAGKALAKRLEHYRDEPNAIVLGLPGGGLAVAAAVSDALNLPLDVFISRKLQAPGHPERTLGAITEAGVIYIDQSAISLQNWLYRELRAYIERECQFQKTEIARLRRLYRGSRNTPSVSGIRVILVDDVITTGATFFAAVDSLRKLGAQSIAGAIPVGRYDVLRDLHYKLDEVIALVRPQKFERSNHHYEDFGELLDGNAARLLTAERSRRLRGLHG